MGGDTISKIWLFEKSTENILITIATTWLSGDDDVFSELYFKSMPLMPQWCVLQSY